MGPCSTSGDQNSPRYDLGPHHCDCHVSTQWAALVSRATLPQAELLCTDSNPCVIHEEQSCVINDAVRPCGGMALCDDPMYRAVVWPRTLGVLCGRPPAPRM
jgi:hypothetical protein